MRKIRLPFYLFVLIPLILFSQDVKFSGDSVYSYIEHLSKKIGPRPMGSDNEELALNWARQKFQAFGADTAFTLWFSQAKSRSITFNTKSGISVGIFKGKTDSAIVVGGHIDSAGEEFPGANDDGSGSSTAIELARIWSQRDRHYTMIFCTFGGEEEGLIGSKHFADNYPGMKDVALMISTDMAGSNEDIVLMFQTDSVMAPQWLVRDAFQVAEETGYDNLYYPTHFATINHIGNGGAGSDHMSFLDKGIPAIDFTAGMNDFPIHTPQDQLEFMTAAMFQNYGGFVDALITRYNNQGIPNEKSTDYYLWNFAGIDFYIPYTLLLIFNIIAVLFGTSAFIYARKKRHKIPKKDRIRWSGMKLFLFMIIIAVFAQFGEAVIQLVKGLRYPWFIEINAFLIFSLLWLIAGIWIVLQLAKRWKFNNDPYSYVLKSYILLIGYILLFSLSGPRLALYPAMVLFLFSIAVYVKSPLMKTVISFLSIIPTVSLIFHEAFDFFAHMMSNVGFSTTNFGLSLAHSAGISLMLILIFIPFIFIYSYAVMTNSILKNNLKIVRAPVYGLSLLGVIFIYGIFLVTLPAYNEMWRPSIHVNAEHDILKNKSELEIVGNEYFTDVQITTDSMDQYIDSGVHKVEIPYAFEESWLKYDGQEDIISGEMDTVRFDWTLTSPQKWMRASVRIIADSGKLVSPASNQVFSHKDSLLLFSWRGAYKDTLNIKGSFLVNPGVKMIRSINARYAMVPDNIKVTSKLANIRNRTTMVLKDTLNISDKIVSITQEEVADEMGI